jgi:hypothetical protein
MQFEVEHVFDAPMDEVEAALFHPDYFAFLLERHDVLTGLSPEAHEEDSAQIRRRVHYKPRAVFESIGPKKVPAHWFEFVEESTWNRQTHTLSFDNVPCTDKVARRFLNRGEIVFESIAPGKTRRRARAELKLHNLPLVLRPLAPLVEQMIAREARKLLETEARVFSEWLVSRSMMPGAPDASCDNELE